MLWPDINSYCDRVISLDVRVGRRLFPAFHVWGLAALTLAAVLGFVLGVRRGFPLWAVVLGIALTGFTFYATAFVTKLLTGDEGITFYHQLITATVVLAALAWLLHQPVLPAVDIALIAVSSTLTLGRIGCLMVGCCHGRPCRVGVRYSAEHAAAGFHSQLVGVRLFPTQAVEFLCMIPIEIVGCFMIWNGHAPGAAAAWFLISYCSTRFCFEFARWPPSYQFRWGLSQYQWISAVLVLLTVALEFTGVLPFQLWHFAVAIILVLAAALVVLERRLRSFDRALKHPDHVRELASALNSAWCATDIGPSPNTVPDSAGIAVTTTSLGLQISASRIRGTTGDGFHYALSSRSGKLTALTADYLLRSILRLQGSAGPTEIVKGSAGVFHLLIPPIGA